MARCCFHGSSLQSVVRLAAAAALLIAGAMLSGSGNLANAGKFNPTLSVGDAAPDWKALPGVDGKPHALSDFADQPFLVVVFTCNTCPTAVDYEDRLIALAKKLGQDKQGAVIAINSNKVADDELPGMKKRAELKSFPFTYLRDDNQQVARAYGATVTPEFFVLDQKRRVVYMGALDDATDAAAVKTNYVDEALAAIRAGKAPSTTETVARGCLVRFGRDRKKN